MNQNQKALRERFLREQQDSLDELAQLADPGAALRDLIAQLSRKASKARTGPRMARYDESDSDVAPRPLRPDRAA